MKELIDIASEIAEDYCSTHPDANPKYVMAIAEKCSFMYEISESLQVYQFQNYVNVSIRTELYNAKHHSIQADTYIPSTINGEYKKSDDAYYKSKPKPAVDKRGRRNDSYITHKDDIIQDLKDGISRDDVINKYKLSKAGLANYIRTWKKEGLIPDNKISKDTKRVKHTSPYKELKDVIIADIINGSYSMAEIAERHELKISTLQWYVSKWKSDGSIPNVKKKPVPVNKNNHLQKSSVREELSGKETIWKETTQRASLADAIKAVEGD